MSFAKLGSGRGNQEERSGRPGEKPFNDGNEAITGPVQVLQHQDHRTGRGTGVNETRPGQLQLPVDGRWPESVERVPWDGDPRS